MTMEDDGRYEICRIGKVRQKCLFWHVMELEIFRGFPIVEDGWIALKQDDAWCRADGTQAALPHRIARPIPAIQCGLSLSRRQPLDWRSNYLSLAPTETRTSRGSEGCRKRYVLISP